MRSPLFKRLFKTDFDQDFQPFIEKLGNLINPILESVTIALNGNLTLRDNSLCQIVEMTIVMTANGIPNPKTVKLDNKIKEIEGTQVIQVKYIPKPSDTVKTNVFPTATPFISYEVDSDRNFKITNIAGLPINNTFTIKFIIHSK